MRVLCLMVSFYFNHEYGCCIEFCDKNTFIKEQSNVRSTYEAFSIALKAISKRFAEYGNLKTLKYPYFVQCLKRVIDAYQLINGAIACGSCQGRNGAYSE